MRTRVCFSNRVLVNHWSMGVYKWYRDYIGGCVYGMSITEWDTRNLGDTNG